MKKENHNLAYTAIGITLVILFFMVIIMSSSCTPNKSTKYVICSQNECDTTDNKNYYGHGGVQYYNNKGEHIIIFGSYTITEIR